MDYICRRDCQYTNETGKIIFVEKGSVISAKKNPRKSSFEALDEEASLDFATASENELMKAKWTVKEAKEAMADLYGYDLVIEADDKKKDVVASIIDARYRNTDS